MTASNPASNLNHPELEFAANAAGFRVSGLRARGAEAPLGKHTEFAAGFDPQNHSKAFDFKEFFVDKKTGEIEAISSAAAAIRTRRYALQRASAEVLGLRHRVNFCLMHLGQDCAGADIKVSETSDGKKKARLGGLAVCANVWACPHCSQAISEGRATEIRKAFSWAKKEGLEVSMLTLTTRHGIKHKAKDLVDAIAASWRDITGHRDWKGENGIRKNRGIEGYIKAFEITRTEKNGWHPHFHIILFSRRKIRKLDLGTIFGHWKDGITKRGLPAPTFNVGIKLNDGSKAGDYINKFGSDDELIKTRSGKDVTWDAADEMSKANSKIPGDSRPDRKVNELAGLKPFQILGSYLDEGCAKSAALYKEYVAATKGKHHLQWSPGLKAKAGVEEKTNEEVAREEENKSRSKVLVSIPRQLWNAYLTAVRQKSACRSDLIRSAELGGVDQVADSLGKALRSVSNLGVDLTDKELRQALVEFTEAQNALAVDVDDKAHEAVTDLIKANRGKPIFERMSKEDIKKAYMSVR